MGSYTREKEKRPLRDFADSAGYKFKIKFARVQFERGRERDVGEDGEMTFSISRRSSTVVCSTERILVEEILEGTIGVHRVCPKGRGQNTYRNCLSLSQSPWREKEKT